MKKVIYLILCLLIFSSFSNKVFAQCGMRSSVKTKSLENQLSEEGDAKIKGELLYSQMCVVCHGESGKGDGVEGVSLSKRPANLTSIRVQQQTDGEIFCRITNGIGSMPSFENSLTTMQRWELINYIKTLN